MRVAQRVGAGVALEVDGRGAQLLAQIVHHPPQQPPVAPVAAGVGGRRALGRRRRPAATGRLGGGRQPVPGRRARQVRSVPVTRHRWAVRPMVVAEDAGWSAGEAGRRSASLRLLASLSEQTGK